MLKWRFLSAWIIAKRDNYLQKRIPIKNSVKLNINNTFILPSTFGWCCIGIVVCLFVLGTNFQNNIILLLCYFILAMVLLAVFHSYFFFIQHEFTFLDISPDYENRQPLLPIQIKSTLDYKGATLVFSVDNKVKGRHSQTNASQTIKLPIGKYVRGYYKCPQVKLSATYGFGLFNCWSILNPTLTFFVYPSPQKSAMTLFRTNSDAQLDHASDSQYVISDDLQGIREHQITDPINHVSWKHVAKGQGMLTKDFSENRGISGWLRLQDLSHLSTEEALRCLCYQIQQLDKDQVQFGVDLGECKILPTEGQAHLHQCLVQLALYQPSSSHVNNASDGNVSHTHSSRVIKQVSMNEK